MEQTAREFDELILVKQLIPSIIIDLRYASTNNFLNKKIYTSKVCALRRNTAVKLLKASKSFEAYGYTLKIWDAYRPLNIQFLFWDLVKDNRFVANPNIRPSIHNRGTAVDVTLVDKAGKELEMPSEFDDFSERAYRDNPDMQPNVRKNLDLLINIMEQNGFRSIDTEWWHFEDVEWQKYEVLDIPLENFQS
jgi:D-alanyl-D-alanine dipeptidase